MTPRPPSGSSPTTVAAIVRALEVIELTGRPFSATLPQLEYVDPATVQIGLRIDRELLEQRIEQRVAAMFDAGLVDEVRRLLDDGLAEGRTASRAIGYQQVIAHLAGDLTLDEARERTVIATRQFARRQLAWWKDDPRITWIEHDAPDRVEQALAAAALRWSRSADVSIRRSRRSVLISTTGARST